MRIWLVGLGLLLATATAEAATITITTTPEQDEALITLRRKLNADRPTPLTMAEFKDYLTAQWVDSWVSQAGEHSKTTLREGWEKATPTTKDQVKTLLGITP